MVFLNKGIINKAVSFFLSATLFASILITPAFAAVGNGAALTDAKSAIPTASKVIVNGSAVSFDAYTIDGNNYFKLRDIANVVTGTGKQFEVSWDGTKNAINLVSGSVYTAVGGELIKGDGIAKQATLSTSKIYKDGREVNLTAYTIKGNNFFKLRDVSQLFDIGVTWDAVANTVGIDTSISYEVPSSSVDSTPAEEYVKLTNEEYQEIMSPIVTAFEKWIIAYTEYVKVYDGSQEWIETFANEYQYFSMCADKMSEIATSVPDDYIETHVNITVAISAYADAFMVITEMIDAFDAGDDAAVEEKMAEYKSLFNAAELLWDSAVE